jgi:hypothetical protein
VGFTCLNVTRDRQVPCEVYRVTVLKVAPHVCEPGPYSGCARSGPAMWRLQLAERGECGGDISVPI